MNNEKIFILGKDCFLVKCFNEKGCRVVPDDDADESKSSPGLFNSHFLIELFITKFLLSSNLRIDFTLHTRQWLFAWQPCIFFLIFWLLTKISLDFFIPLNYCLPSSDSVFYTYTYCISCRKQLTRNFMSRHRVEIAGN